MMWSSSPIFRLKHQSLWNRIKPNVSGMLFDARFHSTNRGDPIQRLCLCSTWMINGCHTSINLNVVRMLLLDSLCMAAINSNCEGCRQMALLSSCRIFLRCLNSKLHFVQPKPTDQLVLMQHPQESIVLRHLPWLEHFSTLCSRPSFGEQSQSNGKVDLWRLSPKNLTGLWQGIFVG